jgi:hypothetical protein
MPIVDLAGARWRTSSRTAGMGNANCVAVAWAESTWRKSARSVGGNNANCVEVVFAGPATAVRDSKNPSGPVIVIPGVAWRRFLAGVKRGTLG